MRIAENSPPPGRGRSAAAGRRLAVNARRNEPTLTPPRRASRVDPPLSGEGITINAPEALIAAYRDGLGLAPVTLVVGESGAHLVRAAEETSLAAGESMQARWWCKSAEQADWLMETAIRAQRCEDDAASRLADGVLNAARRLGLRLRSDAEIEQEAAAVIARLEQEFAAQQRAGALRSVNRGYRDYRLAATARGEKILRYAQWIERYKAKLVRDVAQTLRAI